ncbi:MAG: Hsp20/alpha crystallin family protein [Acidobacteriota bacterium]
MPKSVYQYPHLARIHQEINSLFERFLESPTGSTAGLWDPPSDVFQKGEHVFIRVDLPGIERGEISVLIRSNAVFVRGLKRPTRYPQNALVCFHCMEISHGRFEKVVHMPQIVDARNTTARLKDGVLTVKLPIIRDRRGSEIEVPVEEE